MRKDILLYDLGKSEIECKKKLCYSPVIIYEQTQQYNTDKLFRVSHSS